MDVALSERGRPSRTRLPNGCHGAVQRVYASDLTRAGFLADLLAEPRGLPVRRLSVFRERHMGVLQGIPRPVLETDHADLFGRWQADRIHFRVPEGESFVDLYERIVPAVRELAAAFAGRRVALVSHAGPFASSWPMPWGCRWKTFSASA
jgi:broad specificity phosphatase PhoE